MKEETVDKNDLANYAEKMFENARTGSEEMWETASRYALQLEQGQIYALTHIKFFARKASPKTRDLLMGFYDDYMQLQNQRNTALFIVKLAESDSLRRFWGAGIQGQVKRDVI